ncbi:hypothetical protein [Pseudomarimonas salicorniae]|uniref:Anti-sigma factor n=1 Tax=Pseudomarimonas salicorniae TaxID=2933270 RepID=A0ABT0GJJ3_9GAMM|nr:hypothetical protein [Lysobacter sp. CAU 1642]MCK7594527.1 hypothetical protein [Lysobacter sp. CAU 1642]
MSSDSRDRRVDDYLRGLPGAMPPADLGERILARHASRRRLRRLLPLAAAATLLAGFLAWRAQTPAAPPVLVVDPPAALLDLRSVDRRLQAAYLAGAGETELDRLWNAREQAVAELRGGGHGSGRRQVRL